MSASCTLGEAQSFVRAAVAGHELVYFTADNSDGYAGLDLYMKTRVNPTMRGVVNIMRRSSNEGHIDLFQRREGYKTLYLARWRKRRAPVSEYFESIA